MREHDASGRRGSQLLTLEFREIPFIHPWEKASLELFKPDWITSLSPSFHFLPARLPPFIYTPCSAAAWGAGCLNDAC